MLTFAAWRAGSRHAAYHKHMTHDRPTTYDSLWRRLAPVLGQGEAKAVVRMILGEAFGLTMADICCGRVQTLSSDSAARLEAMMRRLEQAEPVQYVLGRETFAGRVFRVAPGVLIPRPETAQLADMAVATLAARGPHPTALDIGTGSGCIAVTVAAERPDAAVTAWDISAEALSIARDNARRLGAPVAFTRQDALHAPDDKGLWDVIVSNPPYICERERADMDRNVTAYEPATALFVPDDDSLRFYRAIAAYALHALKDGGTLLFETHTGRTGDTAAMLRDMGFAGVRTHNDIYGRPRHVSAEAPSPGR